MFTLFKKKQDENEAAARLYEVIIAQSREPAFYEAYEVPDTVDGRFDLICLHTFLVMNRLFTAGRHGTKLAQGLFDYMFRDMDRVLREMGVGDLGVPKQMKRMMKGFNGRAMAYREALRSEDPYDLVYTIMRNLYGSMPEPSEDNAKIMALYIHETISFLAKQPDESVLQGYIEFKVMDNGEDEEETADPAGMAAQG